MNQINALLEFFAQLDAQDPLLRLLTAAIVIGISVLLIMATRLLVGRRLSRLEAVPDERFRPLRLQAQDLVSGADMKHLWLTVWRGIGWLLSALFMVSAAIGGLMTSSFTLSMAAWLIVTIFDVLAYLWGGFVDYLPDLVTIVVILVIMRYTIRFIGLVFDGIRTRRIYLRNFYPEWAETSYGLVKLMVYALTAVIVFPYLPGSSSPAFQGISIFVGVLVSLGSTTAVSNVVAGIVLTYTRAFQVGDQVEVADVRGEIVEQSTFVTRIRTLKNVIVSIPNSMVLNHNVINYSKNMGPMGVVVHTTLTIGYDVPWQKVSGLLVAAARKTEDVSEHPEPFVLQTSLDDNYVSYELNAWTVVPERLPKTYSDLHANILDEFHANGIEITSPQFRAVRDGNPSTIARVPAPDQGEANPVSPAG